MTDSLFRAPETNTVLLVNYHYCLVTKLCLTLCDPMDCSLLGSSAHGISQARILEWVAISFSRGSSQPRDQTTSPALQTDSILLNHLGSPHSNII